VTNCNANCNFEAQTIFALKLQNHKITSSVILHNAHWCGEQSALHFLHRYVAYGVCSWQQEWKDSNFWFYLDGWTNKCPSWRI